MSSTICSSLALVTSRRYAGGKWQSEGIVGSVPKKIAAYENPQPNSVAGSFFPLSFRITFAICAIACWYWSGAQPKFRPVSVDFARSAGSVNSPSKCRNDGPSCDCIEPTMCMEFLGVAVKPVSILGIGLCAVKSAYVRFPAPGTPCISTTKWHERQLMDCPANGPGRGPFGVCTVATTGSPTASG